MKKYIFLVKTDLWHPVTTGINTTSKTMAIWIMEHTYDKNAFTYIKEEDYANRVN